MGLPELRPIQDCITRWNSALHMLKRVLDSREAIISTLALLNAPIELLYPHEWDIVKEACTAVLEPFDWPLDEAVQRLKTAAANCTRNEPSAPPGNQGEAVSQEVEKHTSTVWRFFDERSTEDTTRRNPSADAILEIRSYLDEPRIQRAKNPLSWWKSKASVYPRLAQVMASRMCIVGTSVPSERIFSKTGLIISERRDRISP
ncbi:hypothetical protein Pmani_020336 [Petrolisthes manimaculis]|uniref:HAT C-terminal dimerisation domain-containing protein n=1 Tax=Petrolisthes manimaculis TaxID=1843537 RepID=A0AAE1PGG4_9EUCA|nr:hypothetical protein Pmani_020336 [Petrolisthes manimaculis]